MIQKPNVFTRLKAAAKFYQHGWRKFQMQQPESKKIPFIWPTWYNGKPQWQLINYEAYASEGFSANAVVYSAIMFKVRSIAIAPLRAYTGDPQQPELLPPEHPLQALCLRPNKFQSWSEFQGLAEIYLNLSGNCYIVLERDGDQIVAMYLLRPDRTYIVPSADRNKLIGFWYVPEGMSWTDGRPYMPQDVMHIKLPNPLDPLDGLGYGLSPLSPAAHNVDVDNDLTKFFRLFFKGGAMPPGVLEFDVPLQDDEVSHARERWMDIYGGFDNWKDVAVLDSGGKYNRVGYTFDEMDVSAIDARNESRTVAPFGVPLTLIESRPELVSSTYDNKQADWTMFWQSTMTPELTWFETEYQYYLQGDGSDFVKFDLSMVPALSMTKEVRIDKFASAHQQGAVTTDEYRAELGLDPKPELDEVEEVESVPPIPESPEPATTTEGQPEAEDEAEETDQSKASGKKKDIDRLAFWTKADQIAVDYEGEFGDAAKDSFEEDLRKVLATITDANDEALADSASLNWDTVMAALAGYFATGAALNWENQFKVPLNALMTEWVDDLNTEFGQTASAAELLGQNWFNEYTIKFAQPINANTEEAIRRLIEQGRNEGWSIPTVKKNIETMFQQWMNGNLTPEAFEWLEARMPEFRRELIARTETMRAANTVSEQLYGEWGVEQHEWLATMDDRVRPAHADANGQVVALGEPFLVGGEELLYPLDPAGSAGNVVNCRCTTIPVL